MYAIREGLKQVFRHPTASLATFFTALVSFTLLYFLGLLLWNLERVVQTMERELEVAAFLGPKADVEGLLAEIQKWPEVASARLQTKEEALALGLVHRVVHAEKLMEEALSLAKELAQGPTRAYALTKKLLLETYRLSLTEALALEAVLQGQAGQTQDHEEGVRAFREKRPPRFQGR